MRRVRSIYWKLYYKKNKEDILAYQKLYRENNKDILKMKADERKLKSSEQITE